jgi:hypothetical protein
MYFVGPHHQGGDWDWTPSQQYEQGGWLLSQQVMEASHLLPEGSQEASPAWRWLWVLCLTIRSPLSSSCPAPRCGLGCFLLVRIDIRHFSGPSTVVLCHLPIHSGTVLVAFFLSLSTYDPFQGPSLWCCVTSPYTLVPSSLLSSCPYRHTTLFRARRYGDVSHSS